MTRGQRILLWVVAAVALIAGLIAPEFIGRGMWNPLKAIYLAGGVIAAYFALRK